jgi:hypothetical protein
MEHICKICIKKYASYNSLWNHNKRKHMMDSVKECKGNVKEKVIKKKYECKNCKKKFSCRQSKYEHIKNICNNISSKKEKKEIIKLKLEIDMLKQEITKSQPTNFKSLNRMLKYKSYNSNNVINSNNTINNTINLIGFGKENILESLSFNDKKTILSSKYQCIEKLIEISNCGNYNQFIQTC